MEAFEQFVAVFLEQQNYVVSSAVKFPYERQTRAGPQIHGFEVDLVGARSDRLLLATVKSYLGSGGVTADNVMGTSSNVAANRRYVLLNDKNLRDSIVRQAAKRYGYKQNQIQLALCAGRFSGPSRGIHEQRVREWCLRQRVGAGKIDVFNLDDMVETVVKDATRGKQYRDNPVLVTMKILQAAGLLSPRVPDLKVGDTE